MRNQNMINYLLLFSMYSRSVGYCIGIIMFMWFNNSKFKIFIIIIQGFRSRPQFYSHNSSVSRFLCKKLPPILHQKLLGFPFDFLQDNTYWLNSQSSRFLQPTFRFLRKASHYRCLEQSGQLLEILFYEILYQYCSAVMIIDIKYNKAFIFSQRIVS